MENLFFFCLNVKYKTNFLTTFIKDLLKKLTDVKIQKGSEDRFSGEKIKILFKEKVKWIFRYDYLGIRNIFVV